MLCLLLESTSEPGPEGVGVEAGKGGRGSHVDSRCSLIITLSHPLKCMTLDQKQNYPNWHNRRTPLGGIVLGGEFGGIGSNPEVISPNGVR